MWFEDKQIVDMNEKHVWVKLQREEGECFDSAVVPCKYFPLNGQYEVFHCNNTVPVTNEKAVAAFNSVEPRTDRCFENTRNVIYAFVNAGLDLTIYVGWRFQNNNYAPEHMCWAVYEDERGKSVLDLSDNQDLIDEFTQEYLNGDPANWQTATNEVFLELQRRLTVPNHERCTPFGVPSKAFLYVGSPCSLEEGKEIRRKLIEEFPHHISLTGLNHKPE